MEPSHIGVSPRRRQAQITLKVIGEMGVVSRGEPTATCHAIVASIQAERALSSHVNVVGKFNPSTKAGAYDSQADFRIQG
jgi:hypothetical protein